MEQLRIPGPTPLHEDVIKAMTKQMINHRGVEFGKILSDATADLKEVFQTRNDVFLLTSSGTGGLEAAIVNTLSPGDKVLSVSVGVFGDRFAKIAQQYGARVIPLNFEWGKAADPDAVRQVLKADPEITTVLVTHNETSTGITNDLGTISAIVKEFDKLLLVDAISSLGSINLPVDEWRCDVVVTGSQKGWMVPPGLAMVSVSEAAWRAGEKAKMPRFYWDFGSARKYAGMDPIQTPWTPAVTTVYALGAALKLLRQEGLTNIFARHARIGNFTRQEVKSLGLSLFADESHASNTVTSIATPNGVDAKKLLTILREEHQVVLAGGQAKLGGKIFRIGHLGLVTESDITQVTSALKVALPQVGFKKTG